MLLIKAAAGCTALRRGEHEMQAEQVGERCNTSMGPRAGCHLKKKKKKKGTRVCECMIRVPSMLWKRGGGYTIRFHDGQPVNKCTIRDFATQKA